ncbi:MAG: hypothetical protein IPI67_10475 [Myxococcales bacterium]|nr:hypothetical protein [Myxococcales bacterium]
MPHLFRVPLAAILAANLVQACSSSSAEPQQQSGQAEKILNESIVLTDEGDPLPEPATDDTIGIGGGAPAGKHIPLEPGGSMTVQIPFESPAGNVIGAGIRFGATGPVKVVNLPQAVGQTQGTLSFTFQVPSSVCDNLSSICHDIKCYEFAVTSSGTISKANISAVALKCGKCDEPSCKSLIDSCGALAVNGIWSGKCPGSSITVKGTFGFNIGTDGQVTGSYDGWDSGQVTGTVKGGQLSAVGGGAGGCQWTGTIGPSGSSGTWGCPDGCGGGWTGSGG